LIETTDASSGSIALDLNTIQANSNGSVDRLDQNLTGQNVNMFNNLIVDPSSSGS
jgi:hypothetical protein